MYLCDFHPWINQSKVDRQPISRLFSLEDVSQLTVSTVNVTLDINAT